METVALEPDAGPCMFWMDIEAPYASNLIEAVLDVAARLGVCLKWGTVHGGELVLVLSGNVPQAEIVSTLTRGAEYATA